MSQLALNSYFSFDPSACLSVRIPKGSVLNYLSPYSLSSEFKYSLYATVNADLKTQGGSIGRASDEESEIKRHELSLAMKKRCGN